MMSTNEDPKDFTITKLCYYDIADLCGKLNTLVYGKGGSLYKLVDIKPDKPNGQTWVEAWWKPVKKEIK